ncbi:hypothetical protein GCM10023187_41260 [Nibrella viscosa]|uniref:Uncharacterized protein n=1 Tax=Nibrella viscosa TaxID=1084524 RepID=A0ABP8KRB0_9BACT
MRTDIWAELLADLHEAEEIAGGEHFYKPLAPTEQKLSVGKVVRICQKQGKY